MRMKNQGNGTGITVSVTFLLYAFKCLGQFICVVQCVSLLSIHVYDAIHEDKRHTVSQYSFLLFFY